MSAAAARGARGGTSFTSHAASDVGKTRTGNEDYYYRGVTVFAVADGMGGHQAGEVASQTAVRPLEEIDGRDWPTVGEAEIALADAVRAANTDVVEQAASNPDYRGMGTTLTAVLVREGRLHVAHVGDSRAYLFRRDGGMTQLTTDHTLVEQLVRDGRISRDEIATHPQRSVITRAIGVETTVEVDTLAPIELVPGDQVLLCSDGLSGPVDDAEIARLLAEVENGDEACEELIRAANAAGGPDNITVVLLRVVDALPRPLDEHAAAGTFVRDPRSNGDADPDTAEFSPVPSSSPNQSVHRISTRTESGGGFDADALGRLGAGPEERVGGILIEDHDVPSRGRRVLGWVVGVVVVIGMLGAGGYFILSRSWFVGLDDGEVAIFQGLPEDVGGVALHQVVERTGIAIADLRPLVGRRLEEGISEGSLQEARERVESLREEAEEAEEAEEEATPPTASPPTRPTPSPRAAPSPGGPNRAPEPEALVTP